LRCEQERQQRDVIDGSDNATATISVESQPFSVAVNPATNKIYVANSGTNTVTMIDGVTNESFNMLVGSAPKFVAANPVTKQNLRRETPARTP